MKFIYLVLASLFLFSCSKTDQIENPQDLVNSLYTHFNVAFEVEEQSKISHYMVVTSNAGKFETAAMIFAGDQAKASYSVNVALDKYRTAGESVVIWKLVTVSVDGSEESSAAQSIRIK